MLLELLGQVKKDELPDSQTVPAAGASLQLLPNELLFIIKSYLSETSDIENLTCTSRLMHSIFQPERILNTFLHCVSYGQQDKVEELFNEVFQRNHEKIQQLICSPGKFTDYSGRTFTCTAFEYAYWAKDTHMCRMLISYMDAKTKAFILERVQTIESSGLSYQQYSKSAQSIHFDLTALKSALQEYCNSFNLWNTANYRTEKVSSWMKVGVAQRDVPAHVAHEYCRMDQFLCPCPDFKDAELPRTLVFHNWMNYKSNSWFPLIDSNKGLGFDFAFGRVHSPPHHNAQPGIISLTMAPLATCLEDLKALNRLDEIRTEELLELQSSLSSNLLSIEMNNI